MEWSRRLFAVTAGGLAWIGVVGVGQALAAKAPAAKAAAVTAPALSFENDVRPILKTYCFDCHGGGDKLQGNLDLRLKRFVVRGGDSGHAIVLRHPEQSLLVKRLKSGEMPPLDKKVPAEQIALIERWISLGAPALRVEPEHLDRGTVISADDRAYWFYQPVRRPVVPVTKTSSRTRDRVRTPIDAFVLKKLREKGLDFAPDADRSTLIRRATLDLTGLPSTPQEVTDFLQDRSEGAYERVLDRLLASPQYGERWGRHWLDVAGYANSDGNGSDDNPRPYAYKYRDYVIRSLNADKPFNQFVIEQLAGDELVPRPWMNLTPQQIELLTATGFLRTAVDGTQGDGSPAASNQVVGDTLKIVCSSLLGLTVGCAQCHDHKYDPIPQTDYYRFRAIFEPALDPSHWRAPNQRLISLYTDADRAKAAAVEAEVQKLQAAFNEKQAKAVTEALEVELQKFPADQREKLRAALQAPADKRTAEQKLLVANNPKLLISPGVLYQYNPKAAEDLNKDQAAINARRAQRPTEDFLSVLTEEPGTVPVTHLFYRGDYRQPTKAITPGGLTIAAPEGGRFEIPDKDATLPTTGRRLAFARHLTDGRHPLVGRVLVNRMWLNHFGRGLVDTPGDFGKLGLKPTNPELLDWLATEFVAPAAPSEPAGNTAKNDRSGARIITVARSARGDGASPNPTDRRLLTADRWACNWSVKKFHRMLMLSTVYRQASIATAHTRSIDSDDAFLSRFPVRRLDAESLRDRMLVAAGRLDLTQFGPPVSLTEDGVGQVSATGDSPRRSVYLQVRRTKPVSFLVAFDAPVMAVNCERRQATNSATQALMLMNSEFVLGEAGHFAERVRKEVPGDLTKQVAAAWMIAYNRPVTPEESNAALQFLRKQQDRQQASGPEKSALAAMTDLCQQLLSSNEFLYVD